MTARTEQILCSIVKSYIETGEPVASGDISRLRRFHASPATIRGVMADLASDGYLHQPHTSAGRVPTEKAFTAFVSQLPSNRVMSAELDRIRTSLENASTVEERAERASHLLTGMTQGLAIATAIPGLGQILEHVELLALGGRRVLMVIVTNDGLVRNQVVTLDEAVTEQELTSVRNYVNAEFGGWNLGGARMELRRRLDRANAAYDRILQRLNSLYDRGLLDLGVEPEVHLDGAANVVGFDLHLTRDRLKDLLLALEEKKLVLRLLDRCLESAPGAAGLVRVQVGLGSEPPGMGEMSLIGLTVTMPGGTAAKFAVLGPMRMDYAKVMSAVLHVGRAFSSLPA